MTMEGGAPEGANLGSLTYGIDVDMEPASAQLEGFDAEVERLRRETLPSIQTAFGQINAAAARLQLPGTQLTEVADSTRDVAAAQQTLAAAIDVTAKAGAAEVAVLREMEATALRITRKEAQRRVARFEALERGEGGAFGRRAPSGVQISSQPGTPPARQLEQGVEGVVARAAGGLVERGTAGRVTAPPATRQFMEQVVVGLRRQIAVREGNLKTRVAAENKAQKEAELRELREILEEDVRRLGAGIFQPAPVPTFISAKSLPGVPRIPARGQAPPTPTRSQLEEQFGITQPHLEELAAMASAQAQALSARTQAGEFPRGGRIQLPTSVVVAREHLKHVNELIRSGSSEFDQLAEQVSATLAPALREWNEASKAARAAAVQAGGQIQQGARQVQEATVAPPRGAPTTPQQPAAAQAAAAPTAAQVQQRIQPAVADVLRDALIRLRDSEQKRTELVRQLVEQQRQAGPEDPRAREIQGQVDALVEQMDQFARELARLAATAGITPEQVAQLREEARAAPAAEQTPVRERTGRAARRAAARAAAPPAPPPPPPPAAPPAPEPEPEPQPEPQPVRAGGRARQTAAAPPTPPPAAAPPAPEPQPEPAPRRRARGTTRAAQEAAVVVEAPQAAAAAAEPTRITPEQIAQVQRQVAQIVVAGLARLRDQEARRTELIRQLKVRQSGISGFDDPRVPGLKQEIDALERQNKQFSDELAQLINTAQLTPEHLQAAPARPELPAVEPPRVGAIAQARQDALRLRREAIQAKALELSDAVRRGREALPEEPDRPLVSAVPTPGAARGADAERERQREALRDHARAQADRQRVEEQQAQEQTAREIAGRPARSAEFLGVQAGIRRVDEAARQARAEREATELADARAAALGAQALALTRRGTARPLVRGRQAQRAAERAGADTEAEQILRARVTGTAAPVQEPAARVQPAHEAPLRPGEERGEISRLLNEVRREAAALQERGAGFAQEARQLLATTANQLEQALSLLPEPGSVREAVGRPAGPTPGATQQAALETRERVGALQAEAARQRGRPGGPQRGAEIFRNRPIATTTNIKALNVQQGDLVQLLSGQFKGLQAQFDRVVADAGNELFAHFITQAGKQVVVAVGRGAKATDFRKLFQRVSPAGEQGQRFRIQMQQLSAQRLTELEGEAQGLFDDLDSLNKDRNDLVAEAKKLTDDDAQRSAQINSELKTVRQEIRRRQDRLAFILGELPPERRLQQLQPRPVTPAAVAEPQPAPAEPQQPPAPRAPRAPEILAPAGTGGRFRSATRAAGFAAVSARLAGGAATTGAAAAPQPPGAVAQPDLQAGIQEAARLQDEVKRIEAALLAGMDGETELATAFRTRLEQINAQLSALAPQILQGATRQAQATAAAPPAQPTTPPPTRGPATAPVTVTPLAAAAMRPVGAPAPPVEAAPPATPGPPAAEAAAGQDRFARAEQDAARAVEDTTEAARENVDAIDAEAEAIRRKLPLLAQLMQSEASTARATAESTAQVQKNADTTTRLSREVQAARDILILSVGEKAAGSRSSFLEAQERGFTGQPNTQERGVQVSARGRGAIVQPPPTNPEDFAARLDEQAQAASAQRATVAAAARQKNQQERLRTERQQAEQTAKDQRRADADTRRTERQAQEKKARAEREERTRVLRKPEEIISRLTPQRQEVARREAGQVARPELVGTNVRLQGRRIDITRENFAAVRQLGLQEAAARDADKASQQFFDNVVSHGRGAQRQMGGLTGTVQKFTALFHGPRGDLLRFITDVAGLGVGISVIGSAGRGLNAIITGSIALESEWERQAREVNIVYKERGAQFQALAAQLAKNPALAGTRGEVAQQLVAGRALTTQFGRELPPGTEETLTKTSQRLALLFNSSLGDMGEAVRSAVQGNAQQLLQATGGRVNLTAPALAERALGPRPAGVTPEQFGARFEALPQAEQMRIRLQALADAATDVDRTTDQATKSLLAYNEGLSKQFTQFKENAAAISTGAFITFFNALADLAAKLPQGIRPPTGQQVADQELINQRLQARGFDVGRERLIEAAHTGPLPSALSIALEQATPEVGTPEHPGRARGPLFEAARQEETQKLAAEQEQAAKHTAEVNAHLAEQKRRQDEITKATQATNQAILAEASAVEEITQSQARAAAAQQIAQAAANRPGGLLGASREDISTIATGRAAVALEQQRAADEAVKKAREGAARALANLLQQQEQQRKQAATAGVGQASAPGPETLVPEAGRPVPEPRAAEPGGRTVGTRSTEEEIRTLDRQTGAAAKLVQIEQGRLNLARAQAAAQDEITLQDLQHQEDVLARQPELTSLRLQQLGVEQDIADAQLDQLRIQNQITLVSRTNLDTEQELLDARQASLAPLRAQEDASFRLQLAQARVRAVVANKALGREADVASIPGNLLEAMQAQLEGAALEPAALLAQRGVTEKERKAQDEDLARQQQLIPLERERRPIEDRLVQDQALQAAIERRKSRLDAEVEVLDLLRQADRDRATRILIQVGYLTVQANQQQRIADAQVAGLSAQDDALQIAIQQLSLDTLDAVATEAIAANRKAAAEAAAKAAAIADAEARKQQQQPAPVPGTGLPQGEIGPPGPPTPPPSGTGLPQGEIGGPEPPPVVLGPTPREIVFAQSEANAQRNAAAIQNLTDALAGILDAIQKGLGAAPRAPSRFQPQGQPPGQPQPGAAAPNVPPALQQRLVTVEEATGQANATSRAILDAQDAFEAELLTRQAGRGGGGGGAGGFQGTDQPQLSPAEELAGRRPQPQPSTPPEPETPQPTEATEPEPIVPDRRIFHSAFIPAGAEPFPDAAQPEPTAAVPALAPSFTLNINGDVTVNDEAEIDARAAQIADEARTQAFQQSRDYLRAVMAQRRGGVVPTLAGARN